MFALKVARSQPKTAASSATKLAPHRSTLVAQFRGSSCETMPFLQSRLDQGSFQPERNEPGINAREQEARRLADQGQTPLQERAVPSWDFSKISIFPPSQQPSSAPLRPQPKLAIGAVNDPLEHEADRVADQVMRMPDRDLSITGAPAQLSRKCAACEEEERVQKLTHGSHLYRTDSVIREGVNANEIAKQEKVCQSGLSATHHFRIRQAPDGWEPDCCKVMESTPTDKLMPVEVPESGCRLIESPSPPTSALAVRPGPKANPAPGPR